MASNDSDQKVNEEYERLKNSNFKQQKLAAWRPVPTITSTTITFLSFGIIFIVIGVIVLSFSNDVVEISKNYENCTPDNDGWCEITFNVAKKMESPVMLYYQLNNFYQNHRRYVKSKSSTQLNGEVLTTEELKNSGDCDPIYTMKDLGKETTYDGTEISENAPANPCGLIAKSFFNDEYKLLTNDDKEIDIDETNIAWEADKELKFSRPKDKDWKKIQWMDVENEHFIVWMRPAGLPNFRKLWGRVRTILEPGDYKLKIKNNYKVSDFNGEKLIVFTTVNAFGGKNNFLGISYIVVGSICIVLAIAFVIGYKVHKKNE